MKTPNTDTFEIGSPRLSIELAWPGSPAQMGARFDLSGHVVQATLDGIHTFCAPEGFDPKRGSGGLGLCNEFKDTTELMYKEAAPGEVFPKIGVGLVTRPDAGEYSFMEHYDKQPYPIDVVAGESEAVFTVRPVDCRGFSAKLIKKLSVCDSTLTIEYTLENTGSRRLELLEYNHNFVCVDGKAVGPDYRLTLPYNIHVDNLPGVLRVSGNEFTWNAVPAPGEAFFCLPGGASDTQPHRWELMHEPTGVGMREIDDFAIEHAALWGMSHVVSFEAFIEIKLNPGETKKWTRTYEFFSR